MQLRRLVLAARGREGSLPGRPHCMPTRLDTSATFLRAQSCGLMLQDPANESSGAAACGWHCMVPCKLQGSCLQPFKAPPGHALEPLHSLTAYCSALEAAAPVLAAADEADAPAREQERRSRCAPCEADGTARPVGGALCTLCLAASWRGSHGCSGSCSCLLLLALKPQRPVASTCPGVCSSLMVSRKDDLEDKKKVARVAEELRGLSDEELVRIMMTGELARQVPLCLLCLLCLLRLSRA